MKTNFNEIIESRVFHDAEQCIEVGFYIPRRSRLVPDTIDEMSNDEKKKKIEKLRAAIANLQTQRTLAKSEDNKPKMDSIDRMIKRFESDIEKVKKL